MQYLSLRALIEEKSSEVEKRLSELCIHNNADKIVFTIYEWYKALLNTMMSTENEIEFYIEEKEKTATAIISFVGESNEEYQYTFQLIKSNNLWRINDIR